MDVKNLGLALSLLVAVSLCSCATTGATTVGQQVHGGIKYTLYKDSRFSRVEKGKDGSLMYDSPELTVSCTQGRLNVNGVNVGMVKSGDHVEVTEYQTVLVNGQIVADNTTGSAANQQRLQQSKFEVTVDPETLRQTRQE